MVGIAPLASALVIAHLKRTRIPLNRATFVPIPLHSSRLRRRGFNQAELIAEQCASYWHRPLVNALIRTVATQQQASIKETQQRFKNVANAFAINASAPSIKKQTIVLVDDVSTSGATLAAAAQTLKAGGANRIIGAVVAKAQ